MTRLYKVLNEDGSAIYGQGSWHLPKNGKPGKKMPPVVGDLVPCENGYHLAREQDLITWLGTRIFVAEAYGEVVSAGNKVVVRSARLLYETGWNNLSPQLFALDCAKHVLPIFEKIYPKDPRPRLAIKAGIDYLNGRIPMVARTAAGEAARGASDAAWFAARAAARDAAWGDAWEATSGAAWEAANAATCAVRAAPRDAARGAKDAAWFAVKAASAVSRESERKWQTQRLLRYLHPNNQEEK